jgi:hypothetical protein
MTKHVHRLASLITEDPDEYAGLEDNDEFEERTANGYGAGANRWEYEEFPFQISGSVYNFQQSIEDGATVPLFYENRIPELQLANENFKEDLEALVDAAELDDQQEKKLEREFAREYHLISRKENRQ